MKLYPPRCYLCAIRTSFILITKLNKKNKLHLDKIRVTRVAISYIYDSYYTHKNSTFKTTLITIYLENFLLTK